MIENLIDRLTRQAKKKVSISSPLVSICKNGDLTIFRTGTFTTPDAAEKALQKKYREGLLGQPIRFFMENSIEHVMTHDGIIMIRTRKNPKK
jgi:hypothetical protein